MSEIYQYSDKDIPEKTDDEIEAANRSRKKGEAILIRVWTLESNQIN